MLLSVGAGPDDFRATWRLAINQSPRDYAHAHLAELAYDPVSVGDGSWVALQDVAGAGLRSFEALSALLSDPAHREALVPRICESIVRESLHAWAQHPLLRNVRATELVVEQLRLHHPQLQQLASAFPEMSISLPGEPQPLPNPLRLVQDPEIFDRIEVSAVLGPAHGDLHPGNVLVNVHDADPAATYRLVDLANFRTDAPLGNDPVHLLLDVVAACLKELSESQRDELIDTLLYDLPADAIPAWLSETIRNSRAAMDAWAREHALADEWHDQIRLAIGVRALSLASRRNAIDGEAAWYLRLAARAFALFSERYPDASTAVTAATRQADVGKVHFACYELTAATSLSRWSDQFDLERVVGLQGEDGVRAGRHWLPRFLRFLRLKRPHKAQAKAAAARELHAEAQRFEGQTACFVRDLAAAVGESPSTGSGASP